MKKTLMLLLVGALLGSTVALAASKIFSDVPTNAWYSNAVTSLSDKGIIEGYPNGTFGPANDVSRAELAVILDRTIQYIEKECTTPNGKAGFIMPADGNCYAPGETIPDTDCKVSSTGTCTPLNQ
jgi:hypothetical protein